MGMGCISDMCDRIEEIASNEHFVLIVGMVGWPYLYFDRNTDYNKFASVVDNACATYGNIAT